MRTGYLPLRWENIPSIGMAWMEWIHSLIESMKLLINDVIFDLILQLQGLVDFLVSPDKKNIVLYYGYFPQKNFQFNIIQA
jgi:hypothetical protein